MKPRPWRRRQRRRAIGASDVPVNNGVRDKFFSRHPGRHHFPPRRCPEQAAVLPAELRGTVVADAMAGRGGFHPFAQHQPARFLQAQLLLELQRRHGRGRLEALVQRGWAHVRRGGEFLDAQRSEEHTSELQSLMRISYAVFCLKKKRRHTKTKLITKKKR